MFVIKEFTKGLDLACDREMPAAESAASQAAPQPSHAAQQPSQNLLNPLTGDSQAFGFIEYFLRLSLHATTTKITSAWEISNPQLTLQFEKRAKDQLILDSWVDVSQLPANNCEEDCIRRGFQFNASGSGMKFSVGRIRLEDGQEAGGVIRRKFLLCKIVVGRSYNAAEDFANIAAIPDGYDSFAIDRDRVSLHQSSDENGCIEEMEYVLKDSAQILPTYIVAFEYDPELERRSRQKSICDNCEAAPATLFCQADSANLCQACDAQLHASKLTARHLRTPLEAGPQTFSACRQHPDKLVEFFCPSCSRPVCVHCKMVGHHSTGDAARHKLITVAEAFRGVSESAKAADPLLESRRQRIFAQMAAVAERAHSIELNAGEIQQQLEEIYKRVLSDLRNITKKKLNILRGDMIELHREMGEIQQLQAFLEYQQTGGNATQFILDWAHHQKLRTELHAFPHFRESIDVQPDIKINGTIQVHIDAAGFPPAGYDSAGTNDHGGQRQSVLFDPTRPRYTISSGRSRTAQTIDFSSLTKTRKPTDYIDTATLNTSSTSPLAKV